MAQEFQAVVSCCVVLGTKPGFSARTAGAGPSHQPQGNSFRSGWIGCSWKGLLSSGNKKMPDCNNCQVLGMWLRFLSTWHKLDLPGKMDPHWGMASFRFTCEQVCGASSCLMMDELPLGPGLYTKANEHTRKKYSSEVSASVPESSPQPSLCDEL